MTRRGLGALTALLSSGLCALALGGALYFYAVIMLGLLWLYALLSCLWAYFTAQCTRRLSAGSVYRGEQAQLFLKARHQCLLPIAPLSAAYRYADQEGSVLFSSVPFRWQDRRLPLNARHVGQYEVQATALCISDLFGLLCLKKKIPLLEQPLTVLPRPFEIEKPRITLGDDGSAALARTQEDYNAPEDVRAYQPGDAMKRIHWKLSSRKKELWVRRFEMPAPPDTLILLDCAAPLGGDMQPEGKENLRDALCETAVAIAKLQMEDGSPVRLPIYGHQANEFSSDLAQNLTLLQEMLAAQPFESGEDFARVLQLELRRMRRTGATVIITTRLDAAVAEAVSSIRRMGPSARLYLCTYTPEDPALLPFVKRLQHHLVEVCYVTPA